MFRKMILAAMLVLPGVVAAQADGINDAQIAHIAYTAGNIDIAAGQQGVAKASNPAVKAFAEEMIRDHGAVNDKALALVKKLGVTPQDNATSQALSKAAADKLAELGKLTGAAFDKAYVANEVAYHKTVNGALKTTLIPNAKNGELKSLLETGLTLFTSHQEHAEHLQMSLPKMRLPLLVAIVLAPASAGANAAHYSISMANMKFGAAPAHLKVDDVIDWKNADIFRHTATVAGQFDIDLKPGGHAAVTLKKAGAFDVTCRFHPGMKLRLMVAK